MKKNCCEKCKYWDYQGDKDGIRKLANCKRYPPIVNYEKFQTGWCNYQSPITVEYNWCGEFKNK